MELDWSSLQKEAATAGLLPDGDYNLIVVDATATSSANGKPMLKVKFRVLDGPHKDKPVWSQFTISAENAIALRIFFQQMAAFGLDAGFFTQLGSSIDSMEIVAKNMINRAVSTTLGHRAWQGSDRNNIEQVNPLQAGVIPPPGLVTGPPSIKPSPGTPVAGPATPSSTSATLTTPTSSSPPPPTSPATPF